MLTEEFINNLLDEGESNHLEILETFQIKSIAKTVCSFLNTAGGIILIGIKENKEIIGVDGSEEITQEIYSFLEKNILPKTTISVSLEIFEQKNIIVIEVIVGSKQPYIYDGSIFYRVSDTTVKATSAQIAQLIHNREEAETHWERQVALGVSFNDLDHEEIQTTIDIINTSGRSSSKKEGMLDFLSYYGLYRNGDFTNATVILFAKNPARYLPQSRIRLAVLATSKTDSFITSDQLLEGNLFKNIDYIQKFIESHTGVSSEFNIKQWQRIDRPQFPILAVREGIMNALIHRDYSNVSGSTSIIYYPDKLEISNNGELPKELSISDLKRSHLSLPHNPDIAQICFLRGLIEKIGRGTLKIVEECSQAGLKEPKWISKSGTITLAFYNKPIFREARSIETTQLNERQIKIIDLVAPGDSINVIDYLHYTNMPLTDRSARNDLSLIVEGGWFIKQGSGRNTRYFRTNRGLS